MSLPRSRHALEYWMELIDQIDDAHVALFLDYDELLLPASAQMRKTMVFSTIRQQLKKLTSYCQLAILSEHDCRSIANSVDIPEIIYAGNDGLDICGPTIRISTSEPISRQVNLNVERVIRDLSGIPDISIEASRFSLSVDYSGNPNARSTVEEVLDDIISNDSKWKKSKGDGFYELHPNLIFNRQTAICQILKHLKPRHNYLPLLISYDVNERDTLLALGEWGIGIQVTPAAQTTSSARFYLHNAAEIVELLTQLQLFFEHRQDFDSRYKT